MKVALGSLVISYIMSSRKLWLGGPLSVSCIVSASVHSYAHLGPRRPSGILHYVKQKIMASWATFPKLCCICLSTYICSSGSLEKVVWHPRVCQAFGNCMWDYAGDILSHKHDPFKLFYPRLLWNSVESLSITKCNRVVQLSMIFFTKK